MQWLTRFKGAVKVDDSELAVLKAKQLNWDRAHMGILPNCLGTSSYRGATSLLERCALNVHHDRRRKPIDIYINELVFATILLPLHALFETGPSRASRDKPTTRGVIIK
jgi:hypothetical protein